MFFEFLTNNYVNSSNEKFIYKNPKLNAKTADENKAKKRIEKFKINLNISFGSSADVSRAVRKSRVQKWCLLNSTNWEQFENVFIRSIFIKYSITIEVAPQQQPPHTLSLLLHFHLFCFACDCVDLTNMISTNVWSLFVFRRQTIDFRSSQQMPSRIGLRFGTSQNEVFLYQTERMMSMWCRWLSPSLHLRR